MIGEIILTTRIKSRPQSLLQRVMSDADYDYLGSGDVEKIAITLQKELYEQDFRFNDEEWNKIQIKFLEKHFYYTASSIAMRRPKKLEYYEYLRTLQFQCLGKHKNHFFTD